jgi:uncharacterized protein YjiS (DUF1127 family)
MMLEDAMTTMSLDTVALRPHRPRWRHARATVAEWHRRARSRAELMGLNDRILHDIGVSRASADFEACKPFWMA